MLFQRYMTGRGNLGYGFRAQTMKVPNASYLNLRASDTGDTKRLLLEIMTTRYNELAAIGSCYDREQSNGYTDILIADSEGGAEWESILDNPGRLLYLPHITKDEFLEISNNGKTVSLGSGEQLDLPQVTHQWDQRFRLDDHILAELVADIWYAASKRLTEADYPTGWPVINIQLTEEHEWENTVDIGREFYCNVLMPALPRMLRKIVSVSIGGMYSDVANPSSGGAAAVLITLPDEQVNIVPGTYVLTPDTTHYQSLNPFQDIEAWRSFGYAVLQYARKGLVELQGKEGYLNDFFSAAELIHRKEEYHSLQHLTANWSFAFLLYNCHMSAENAIQQTNEYSQEVSSEDLNTSFDENVWESADLSMLTEFGIAYEEARSCYIHMENHMLSAMLHNRRILISRERYEALFKSAFMLDVIQDAVIRDELQEKYDSLLLRGTQSDANNAAECILELISQPEYGELLKNSPLRLSVLMEKALAGWKTVPTEEQLRMLAAYAANGSKESRLATEYAVELLNRTDDCSHLKIFRPVQHGSMLDQAIVEYFRRYDNIKRCTDAEFRSALRNYAETRADQAAMPEAQLKQHFAETIGGYVSENAAAFRNQLDQMRKMFMDIGMEQSEETAQALTSCLGSTDQPFADSDVPHAVFVLSSEHQDCAEKLLLILQELFEAALPDMFERAKNTMVSSYMVVDRCWLDCISRTAGDVREKLRMQLAGCMQHYVLAEQDTMRYQLRHVIQAFGELGLEHGRDEAAMQALCACMEVPDVAFTIADAEDILPVLRSATPCAGRMANAVLKTFENALPALLEDQTNPESQPWRLCARDKKLSDAQQKLESELRQCLQRYTVEKAPELAMRLGRVMEMLIAYGCTESAQILGACCKFLHCRAKMPDDDACLCETDLQILSGPLFRTMDDAGKTALTDALHALFNKELLKMIRDDQSRELWRRCLKNKYVGEMLRSRIAATIHDYVLKNAQELCYDLPGVMEIYEVFGGDREQRMSGWCALLQALEQNERGNCIINANYVEFLTRDMMQTATEEQIHQIVSVFRTDLTWMIQYASLSEWVEMNHKLSTYLPAWKVMAQNEFAEFVNAYMQTEMSEDRLSTLLELVLAMGWERSETVRSAAVKYFLSLDRDTLSRAEMEGLLSLRSGMNREIDSGLSKVFARSMPRMLEGAAAEAAAETRLWTSAAAAIDLKDAFMKGLEAIQKNGAEEEGSALALTPLAMIRFGENFNRLLPLAAEQAIIMIGQRKVQQMSEGLVASRLMDEEEHTAVLSAVRACNYQPLLYRYIDLLAYEPGDAESLDHEKLLRKEMSEMRRSLFPLMTADAATYAVRKSPVWQHEVQQALLSRLKRMTSASELRFQELCQLPERWQTECKTWPFADFANLIRFVPEKEQLEEAVCEGAQAVVKRSSLSELSQNAITTEDSWYAPLIRMLVAQRMGEDAMLLTQECEDPQSVRNLQQLLETNTEIPAGITQALQLILHGGKDENVQITYERLYDLGEEGMPVALTLLRKAVFGGRNDQWKELWPAGNCSARIPLAAICYLGGEDKDWEAFLNEILRDTAVDKKAISAGNDPAQALIFASCVLQELSMHKEAEELTNQFKRLCRKEYAHVRAIGLKRRELLALKDANAWKNTGASASLYQLLFNKN